MELWIPITLVAAFLQNLRSVGQKHLKASMGTLGATFVRFAFGLPFALVFVAILHWGMDMRLPALNGSFVLWASLAGGSQILAQFLLIHLFSFRNFAVGTAYSRTEPAQAALFGLLFLSETISFGVLVAIAICVIGVMLISVAHTPVNPRSLVTSVFQKTSLIGLASGMGFGVAAVGYRAASLSLGGPNFMMQAAVTLVFTLTMQTLVMFAWMIFVDRGEFERMRRAWKPGLFVGATGATASFGWFSAMTLQQAAVVKALAQVEMIFAFAAAVFFFREKINRLEVAGCFLIVAGIVVLVLLG
ncbi:EamA family transporter [Tianweitania sp. BSSL-BM11]|uniref:EamA family transporter n=1 Tax=Tianweitania aestuarii TaxID=2814886 RepID=A0ABS5RSQ7_9HYPH|nr:EamA family transporter [Tianweitania aestuarii]MBS9719357.1 EamA family transporter [Tianweitania aestuarii]